MNKRAHTPELESIRGLAALLIVFHHFPGWNPYLYDTNLFRMGNSMVDLFLPIFCQ